MASFWILVSDTTWEDGTYHGYYTVTWRKVEDTAIERVRFGPHYEFVCGGFRTPGAAWKFIRENAPEGFVRLQA